MDCSGVKEVEPSEWGAKSIISLRAFREDMEKFLGKGIQIYILD
jgi:hypothetical protein